MSDHWTPRVTARAELADLLMSRHLARATAAGLTVADLEQLSHHGHAAHQADHLQKEQLATLTVERSGRGIAAGDVLHREDALRDRIPAVIHDLQSASDPNHRALGQWLAHLSFARYRYREITLPAGPPPDENELKAVRRVERGDVASRLDGLIAFCTALRRSGREPIVACLNARGISPEALDALSADASALAAQGRNLPRAADATAVEAEAVAAQKQIWNRVRRMVRKAVGDVPELARKYADC